MAEENGGAFDFEFRDYLSVLWRRKWLVLLAVAIVVGVGVTRSVRQDKVYRATGQILLDVERADAGTVETEVRILESEAVADLAKQKRPGVVPVGGGQVGTTRIVTVSAESRSPRLAADSVNTYVEAYTDYRREQQLQKLLSSTDQARRRLEQNQAQIDTLTGEIDQQSATVDRLTGQAAGQARRALDDRIRTRESLRSQQLVLEGKLRDLEIANDFTSGGAEVVSPASVPSAPIRPQPVNDAITALAMGLLLGLALAYLFEYLDDSIKSKDDVQRAIGSEVAVVATIPIATEWKDRSTPEVVALTAPRSSTAEAYRALRTSVQFASLERPLNSLAITSPTAGEGKTTVLANLAVVIAGAGRRVVLLDCDLRRPRIHSFFGLSNEVGFTSWIIGDAPLSSALVEVPGVRRVSMVPSGPIPPNPSELLASRRFPELVRTLQADGALVLIDTPPLLPVTDAAVIARSIDSVLLVTSVTKSSRRDLRHAADILRQVDAPFAGIVLNMVDGDRGRYYRSGYYLPEDLGQTKRGTRAAASGGG